ncbi:MAG: hypothetical protein JWR10_1665 [Rubritepida sp.]|nr:hypothetical protein [Rubritepida sp.]
MSRTLLCATVALIGVAALPFAGAALAQNDAATRQLIERLRPNDQPTRGIRMPGSDSGTAAPAPDAPPAYPAPRSSGAPSSTPARPAATQPRETTAPAGVSAVSITVNFPTGSATLSPQAAAALASLGRALSSAELAPFRFRIEGHTDTVGDAALNMSLSQKRADAVREFLLSRFNVAPDRLSSAGMGEGQLLVQTPDQTAEARNRRVQVVNVGG